MAATHTPQPRKEASTTRAEVTVVIVNFNGRHHLQRCLRSLAKTREVAFEVIVVDNGSTDGSVGWVEANYPQVRVLPLDRNVGFGAANHEALRRVETRFVAFLNNDTVVHPRWLTPLVETLNRFPDVVAACSTLRLLSHPQLYNARGGGMTWLGFGFDRFFGYPVARSDILPPQEDVLFPTAAACLVRKDDFVELGGFDPAFFMYHEDVDFGWRAWLFGKRVVVCRDSVVWHAFSGTTKTTGGARRRYVLGSRHLLRSVLKNSAASRIPRILWNLYKVWWQQGALVVALHATTWNLFRLGDTLGQRRKIQRRRQRSDGELIRLGLLEEAPFPAPNPALPFPEDPSALVPSPLLFPGQDSARGRLGYGWYPRTTPKGAPFGETVGRALCWLKLHPHAEGTLSLTVRSPFPTPLEGNLDVTVNGRRWSFPAPPPQWQTIPIPAHADARGLLRVVLEAPEGRPHHFLGNRDFRPVALQVGEIRFEPFHHKTLPENPKVSVVIPTYNRWEALQLTMEALCQQSIEGFEVVVVDDGSSDGTGERLQVWARDRCPPFSLIYLPQANAGPASARNRGVRAASGDLIVFLGDDTIPERDFLDAHLTAHHHHPEPCAVVGLTLWDQKRMRVTPFLRYVNLWGAQFSYGFFADGQEMTFTSLYTSNLSVPRVLLGEHPFQEAFGRAAWEDSELGYRLCRRGVRILYCEQAKTHHWHPLTMTRFLQRQATVGNEFHTLLRLHPELDGDVVLPPAEPRGKIRLVSRAALWGTPVAALLDRLGVPLPMRAYKALVLGAFYRGRRQGKT